MPAPNLTTLFDFEGQFEEAAQAVLHAVLVSAYVTGQDEQVPEINTAIAFDLGPAVAEKFVQLTKPASWPAGIDPRTGRPFANPQEYFMYSATLEFRVEVPRDDREPTTPGVRSMLSQIRGALRAEMMQCVRPFNNVNLPYYQVNRIRPEGTSTGPGGGNKNTDVTILRFTIGFEILKGAWPAWVEP